MLPKSVFSSDEKGSELAPVTLEDDEEDEKAHQPRQSEDNDLLAFIGWHNTLKQHSGAYSQLMCVSIVLQQPALTVVVEYVPAVLLGLTAVIIALNANQSTLWPPAILLILVRWTFDAATYTFVNAWINDTLKKALLEVWMAPHSMNNAKAYYVADRMLSLSMFLTSYGSVQVRIACHDKLGVIIGYVKQTERIGLPLFITAVFGPELGVQNNSLVVAFFLICFGTMQTWMTVKVSGTFLRRMQRIRKELQDMSSRECCHSGRPKTDEFSFPEQNPTFQRRRLGGPPALMSFLRGLISTDSTHGDLPLPLLEVVDRLLFYYGLAYACAMGSFLSYYATVTGGHWSYYLIAPIVFVTAAVATNVNPSLSRGNHAWNRKIAMASLISTILTVLIFSIHFPYHDDDRDLLFVYRARACMAALIYWSLFNTMFTWWRAVIHQS